MKNLCNFNIEQQFQLTWSYSIWNFIKIVLLQRPEKCFAPSRQKILFCPVLNNQLSNLVNSFFILKTFYFILWINSFQTTIYNKISTEKIEIIENKKVIKELRSQQILMLLIKYYTNFQFIGAKRFKSCENFKIFNFL